IKHVGHDSDKINLNQIINHSRVDRNVFELRLRYVKQRISYLNKKPDVDVDFDDPKQTSIVGDTTIIIRYWIPWTGPTNNKYLQMKYSNADTCWNGLARSFIVTFECGIEHQIVNIHEPNRYQYTITFKTTLVCTKASTEELLDTHDEL
ncbi:unnamed protein product, partial [Rotaria sp. Silwood1]